MRPIRMILPPVLAGLALPLAADPGPLEFFSNSPAGYSSQTSNEAFPVGNGKLAAMIYGDAMDRLWGPMEPVPEDRLVPLEDDATLEVGGARYRVLHTPGHAKHHLALIDPDGGAFVGDAAGILLPGVPLIRPALPPPETDLEAAAASCERLAGENLARLWLTHFGVVDDVAAHLDAVVRRNAEWGAEVKAGMDAAEDETALIRRVRRMEDAELDAAGVRGDVRESYKASSDARMTVMGLVRYWLGKGRA